MIPVAPCETYLVLALFRRSFLYGVIFSVTRTAEENDPGYDKSGLVHFNLSGK